MNPYRTIESTQLFVTLGEAKHHLRVRFDADDALIEGQILTVQNLIEKFTRRSLLLQTWEMTLDRFPVGKIQLPFSPVIQVTGITYIDPDGAPITWSTSEYSVFTNKMPGFVELAFDKSYPSTRSVTDAIKITYEAGYARRELIPPMIRHAGLLMLGHFYERREETIVGAPITKIPAGFETLLSYYKVFV